MSRYSPAEGGRSNAKVGIRASVAAAAVSLLLLLLSAGPASAAPPATVSGPVPGTVGGAPGALFTTTYDLADVGYRQSEFFLSGTASSYVPVSPLTTDGKWRVKAAASAPYKTRAIVYRPSNPRDFNGTVYVSWLNVSLGADLATEWLYAQTQLVREGAAVVMVSAQKVGLDNAILKDPARYGTLSHPGDSFSYSIFSQAGQAVRDRSFQLLDGLKPKRLIAIGQSQSGHRLHTYLNALQPIDRVYDGVLLWSRLLPSAGAELSQAPQAVVPVPDGSRVRADQVPVLAFQTETDSVRMLANSLQQPDSPLFRLWDVAGAAHGDTYLAIYTTDTGDRFATADFIFNGMLGPLKSVPAGEFQIDCNVGINMGVQHYVAEAAFAALDKWVRTGNPPRSAPRFQYSSMSPPTYARDAFGNVLGGIRTPFVDVPLATVTGTPHPENPAACVLGGSTVPFSQGQIEALYPTHKRFVKAWNRATNEAVKNGWIVAVNKQPLKAVADMADIGG